MSENSESTPGEQVGEPVVTRAETLGVYLTDVQWQSATALLESYRVPSNAFTPEDFAAFGQSFDYEFWDEADDSRWGNEFERIYDTVTAREIIITELLKRNDALSDELSRLRSSAKDPDTIAAQIVEALADYGCLSDGGGIDEEEPTLEDTEEIERVARGVIVTILRNVP